MSTSSAATNSDDPTTATGLDLAVLIGHLSSDPVSTTLASGSVLHRYEVTVRHAEGTDTVPVVTFDARRPPKVAAGDRVAVVGRVRRRFYRAGGATRSATEVVASSVTRAGRNRRILHALEDAVGAVSASARPGT